MIMTKLPDEILSEKYISSVMQRTGLKENNVLAMQEMLITLSALAGNHTSRTAFGGIFIGIFISDPGGRKEDGMFSYKPKSVIAYLRKKFPEEDWKAVKAGSGSWNYENNKGERAWWCSALAPRYDGDDDTFVSQFHIYRKTGAVREYFDEVKP